MRNFIKLGKVYPELFCSLESIQFSLDPHFSEHTWRNRVELFKNAVLLLEEMDHLNETSGFAKRKYLIVLDAKCHVRLGPAQLKLFAVPDELWPLLTDKATPHLSSCTNCQVGNPIPNSTLVIYQDCESHGIDWKNIGRFVSELQEGKINLRMLKCPGYGDSDDEVEEEQDKIANIYMDSEKNWKVLFDVQQHSLRQLKNAWTDAIAELSSRQGTRRKSKQQSRKRKAVD